MIDSNNISAGEKVDCVDRDNRSCMNMDCPKEVQMNNSMECE